MLVYIVTSCGCFECAEPNLVYAGVARGIDGTPLRYVDAQNIIDLWLFDLELKPTTAILLV